MHNVQHKVEGDKLIITVDICKSKIDAAPFSKSGSVKLVASASGQPTDDIRFMLNVMTK